MLPKEEGGGFNTEKRQEKIHWCVNRARRISVDESSEALMEAAHGVDGHAIHI